MKKILLLDTNQAFTSDVESRLILDSIDDADIIIGTNFDNVSIDIEKYKPTELVLNTALLSARPDWKIGIPVRCYARSAEGIAEANERDIPCYGIIKTAKDLLSSIESEKFVEVVSERSAAPKKQDDYVQKTISDTLKPSQTPDPQMNATETQSSPEKQPGVQNQSGAEIPMSKMTMEQMQAMMMQMFQQMQNQGNSGTATQEGQTTLLQPDMQNQPWRTNEMKDQQMFQVAHPIPESDPASTVKPDDILGAHSEHKNIKEKLEESRRKKEEEERERTEAIRRKQEAEANAAVENDLGNVRKPAKVITVYSAKGGVGKTTLSCELATFLALTSHGRGKFRVCIADFNIDFGDVLNTLSYSAEKACMSYWAADIQSQLDFGKRPEEITYTEDQISVYLQQNEKDGLFALLAPFTNEDSMEITEDQIEIMLDNLIKNGGFDFVVCDTGNNTRDSSIISLEKADEVLLVMTQDVNTANCNNGFLSTMSKIGFDLNKIRLVINKAQPAKMVAISTDELVEAFINPLTNDQYPCVGKIKYDNEVKHMNNLGKPLVYNSSSDFTKSIGAIASEVIGEEFTLGVPEKRGLFGRLFGKKKK